MNKIADTRGRGGQQRMQRKLLAILVAGCFGAGTAGANPLGAQVVNGQAGFSSQGSTLNITNSPGAIINWQSFSINQGETTRFLQQSAGSAVLNRITGQDPSQILGTLQSNGQVFLINPNGILFGQGARIDVNGLVASTLDISNSDFLAGKRNFTAGAQAGAISNQGTIATPSGGQVYLIAPNVENSGIINAPDGTVLLAAGHSVQLADSSDPAMQVVVSAPADQALNLGSVVAQGGRIGIYGALVNQRGIVNADSAVVGADGRIVLKASNTTLLEAGSRTSATGAGSGGNIQILGQQVGLDGNAEVDASGRNGGGTVLIGGDYQGSNPAVQNAQRVYLGKDVSVSADATESGDGGKLVVWSDLSTKAYGSLSAKGGAQSGNGGRIETSGHYLDIAGIRVAADAAHGSAGNWLLDPYDITVTVDGGSPVLTDFDQFSDPPSSGPSWIDPGAISSASADVTLQAMHDITFSNAVNITAGNVGLSAQAGNNINVDYGINTQGGGVTLAANYGTYATGSGAINISAPISTLGGALNLSGAAITLLNSLSAGPTTLLADKMALGGGTITAIGNPVTLAPVTPGTAIDFATVSTDLTPNTLELSNQELSGINASNLVIGDAASSGPITIKSMPSTGFQSLSLLSAGPITEDPGAALGGALSLRLEGSAVTLMGANPTGVIAGKTTSGDFQYHSINGISIETVDGRNGLTVPAGANAMLISESNIGQNSPISGGGLALVATGRVDLMNSQNNVGTISGILNSSSTGSDGFNFFNAGNLEVGSIPYSGGALNGITGANSAIMLTTGTHARLTVSQPITAGTGSVDLETDSLTLNNMVTASEASIRPHSGGRPITVGSSVCHEVDPGDGSCLSITNLYRVAAGTIGIGRDGTSGSSSGGSLPGSIYVAGITSGVSTATDRNALTTRIGLLSGAGVSQGSGFGIDVQDLGAIAGGSGSVSLTNANNKVSNLAGLTQGGDFAFADATDLNVTTLSGSNSVSFSSSSSQPGAQSPSSTGGGYSVAGIDAGTGNIALKSSGAISGGPVAGNDLSASAGAGITLVTKVASLSASNTDNTGSSNISISNSGVLSLNDVRQAGTAGGGITIDNVGALTVAAGHTVSTGSGDIGLDAHSPLTVNGTVASTSGAIDLDAMSSVAGGDILTINGSVVTGGSVTLEAGTSIVVNGLLSGASVSKNGGVTTSESDCSSNPSLSGCDAIKSTTNTIVDTASTETSTETSTESNSSTDLIASSSTGQDSETATGSEATGNQTDKEKDDKSDEKKDDKKNTSSPEDKGAKKNDTAKKMYCN